jgi:hypothetical protein
MKETNQWSFFDSRLIIQDLLAIKELFLFKSTNLKQANIFPFSEINHDC